MQLNSGSGLQLDRQAAKLPGHVVIKAEVNVDENNKEVMGRSGERAKETGAMYLELTAVSIMNWSTRHKRDSGKRRSQ